MIYTAQQAIYPALKTLYSKKTIEDATYKDFPLFAMLPKTTDFFGEDKKFLIKHGRPQGRSSTFARAKANKSNSKYKAFYLTRVNEYGMVDIRNEDILASQNNMGAFVRWLKTETDGAIETVKNCYAWTMYANGSGKLSTVKGVYANAANAIAETSELADNAGAFIKLENPDDVVRFEVDQVLRFALDESSAPRTGIIAGPLDRVKVKSVDRENGIIELEAALLSGIVLDNDAIFTDGDYNSAGDRLKIAGLDAWIPETAPTSASEATLSGYGTDKFFRVDRSIDPTRLAGIRVDGTGLPIEEALTKAITVGGREGANFGHYFVSWNKWQELQNALGAKVVYVKTSAYNRADINFTGIQISGGKRPVIVMPDPTCPDKTAWGLSLETWELTSLGEPVQILNLDGNDLLRNTDEDSVEFRIGGYLNLGCTAPGMNVRVKLD